MRRYTTEEERRIRMQASVRGWARAGLIDAAQAVRIDGQLDTGLKRTSALVRAALAAFTALIVAAAVGLVFVTFRPSGDAETAVTLVLAGLVCFALADTIVGVLRVYRYGVEETLAALAAVFLSVAALAYSSGGPAGDVQVGLIAALSVGAAASFVVYKRFGFVYAAVGATLCAALVPAQFHRSSAIDTLLAAAVLAAVFVVARTLSRRHGVDFPADDYAVIEAAACAGVYLALNLHAVDAAAPWLWRRASTTARWFYWTTYAATWIVPAAALADGIRAKDRPLIVVGTALALVTLATNKLYLGMPGQTWDPILVGVVLIGGAIALRRWLAAGPDGARGGYTIERTPAGDPDLLQLAANASVGWHGRLHQLPAAGDAAPAQFEGGRSGGGGGSAGY